MMSEPILNHATMRRPTKEEAREMPKDWSELTNRELWMHCGEEVGVDEPLWGGGRG